MRACLAFLVCLLGSACPLLLSLSEYDLWYREFLKRLRPVRSYTLSEDEYHHRLKIFIKNMEFAQSENQKGHGYVLGDSPFADYTEEEFRSISILPSLSPRSESLDWTTRGAVNPPRDQRECGACYAFSAVATLEGMLAIRNHSLPRLSVQEQIDCSVKQGNHGCTGGNPHNSFQYALASGSVCREASYPFEERAGTCRRSACRDSVPLQSLYNSVRSLTSESALLRAVEAHPQAVSLISSPFQLYVSGIFDSAAACNAYEVDHAVTVVGYGSSSSGMDFWKIQNSWGTSWGENGYFRLKRGGSSRGLCGILESSFEPYTSSLPSSTIGIVIVVVVCFVIVVCVVVCVVKAVRQRRNRSILDPSAVVIPVVPSGDIQQRQAPSAYFVPNQSSRAPSYYSPTGYPVAQGYPVPQGYPSASSHARPNAFPPSYATPGTYAVE